MRNGFNVVIWDKQNQSSSAANYNTSAPTPSFDFTAEYDAKKNSIHFEASNIQNNPEVVRETTVYLYDRKNITDSQE